ncbi:hydroxylamine reductase [Clostridiaceae bacterium M8S5]|nr:hydroxylamine reductase [Clostridiaceae bacterium M8S5]
MKLDSMFCYQCEQTIGSKGCTKAGNCGKNAEVAGLQDLLIYQLKGIGYCGMKLIEKEHEIDDEASRFMADASFATLTNVNFDDERFVEYLKKADEIKKRLRQSLGDISNVPKEVSYELPETEEAMLIDSKKAGIMYDENLNPDIRSLREMLIYGMKGMGAYAHHAQVLGYRSKEVDEFFFKGFGATIDDSLTIDDLFELNMEFGKANLECMRLLDEANTHSYGNPVPTEVLITMKKGPFIIVSGHDLRDLKELLEQTEGKGINIYTHGEMLPAHGYPELKKYKHLVGNFGGAWQNQQKEFDGIQGAILMTTNCLQKPRDSYKDRIYTTSIVGYPEIKHIKSEDNKKDFSQIIEKALELGGTQEDEPEKKILVGFGHNTVIGVADKVIDAVKKGAIKHFFLIGGCDGARPGRNYYTEFAQKTPEDTIILTLACGKYRFNKLDFGNIGDLPRLLDVGQCNDAYSAIKIALALADAFECTVNDLPLTMILSWYEQKAVCILITLLSLGIKGIRLGPTLPAFISPNVLQVLIDKFDIKPISTPDDDLKVILG